MAENLQHLITRVKTEAVEEAEAESERILGNARKEAKDLVADAEKTAAEITAKARQEAEAEEERTRRTLEQAARDLLLSLGESVDQILQNILRSDTREALHSDFLPQLIEKTVLAYASDSNAAIEVTVSEEDREAVVQYVQQQVQEKMKGTVTVSSDRDLFDGFSVSIQGDAVEHEFTSAAIADSLGKFLSPDVAAIVRDAAAQKDS